MSTYEVTIPNGEWTDLPAGPVVWQESGTDQLVAVKTDPRVFILPAGCEWRVAV